MALDDPRFRSAVRFTLKSIVVVLWTPIVLATLGLFVAAPRIRADGRSETEQSVRAQRLRFVFAVAQDAAGTRHGGDLAAALEFAPRSSLSPGFDPASTWIARERVPASSSPALAVFADGHVAPLDR